MQKFCKQQSICKCEWLDLHVMEIPFSVVVCSSMLHAETPLPRAQNDL